MKIYPNLSKVKDAINAVFLFLTCRGKKKENEKKKKKDKVATVNNDDQDKNEESKD